MMCSSALFFMISLFTLPMVLVMPAKFALTWTMGSILFLSSYSILNGWKAHLKHLFCWERAIFTCSYLGSMIGTLYFSVVSPHYLPVIIFIILQVVALAWYLASYIPGGTNGLKWMTRATVGLPV
jgi:hypothetical protein